jgi:hypothetical protein
MIMFIKYASDIKCRESGREEGGKEEGGTEGIGIGIHAQLR